jgi:hypothetical protein
MPFLAKICIVIGCIVIAVEAGDSLGWFAGLLIAFALAILVPPEWLP